MQFLRGVVDYIKRLLKLETHSFKSREEYILAKVLISLESLKDAGYIKGGFSIIKRAELARDVKGYESEGNAPMSDAEMKEAFAFLRHETTTVGSVNE